MGIFHQFPYANLHDLNVDWILQTIKKLDKIYESVPEDLQNYVNNWLDEHPEATTTVADNSIDKNKLASDVLSSYVLIPDEFDGTDTEKLQACFDALATTGGHIVINRPYYFEADIINYSDSNLDNPIYIHGLGVRARFEMGQYCFKGAWESNSTMATGNLFFENIYFNGTATCFDCNTLIRMYITNCYFKGFNYFFACEANNNSGRFQTIYISNCVFRRGGIVFHNAGQANDIHIVNNNFEYVTSVWYDEENTRTTKLTFDGNLAEGLRGWTIKIWRGVGVNITNNYFEANAHYLDFSSGNSHGTIISGNMAVNAVGTVDVPFVILPVYSPQWTEKYSNSIVNNTMAWKTMLIIAFNDTPHSKINWCVENNYAPDIPQNYLHFLDKGSGFDSFGTVLTDFNSAISPGLYSNENDAPNGPVTGTSGNLLVLEGGGRFMVQEYIPMSTPDIFYRRTAIAPGYVASGLPNIQWSEWKAFSKDRAKDYIVSYEEPLSVAMEAYHSYLIVISRGTNVGMYLAKCASTGSGNIVTISALENVGEMEISNFTFTIQNSSIEQKICITDMG